MFRSARLVVSTTLVLMLLCSVVSARRAGASAGTPGPGWELTASTYPTNLQPGGTGFIVIHVFNVGAASSSGAVTVTDTLPPGLTATKAGEISQLGGEEFEISQNQIGHSLWDCGGPKVMSCINAPEAMPSLTGGGGGPGGEGPSFAPEIAIAVKVAPNASGSEINRVSIAGGGALNTASTTDPITISDSLPAFGFPVWDAWFSNADGTLDTQAGSHPYEATFNFDLPNVHCDSADMKVATASHGCREGEALGTGFHSVGSVRNIEVGVPPGVIGDPNAVVQCTRKQLDVGKCPDDSQIGIATAEIEGGLMQRWRVYNMVPPAGSPAEFGFSIIGIVTLLDSSVRSGSDYGITTTAINTPQVNLVSFSLILWGVPGDPSHAPWRGNEQLGGCSQSEIEKGECPSPKQPMQEPFLTLPTSCAGPQWFTIRANTWQEPANEVEATVLSHDSNGSPVGFTGCERLDFAPTITTSPDTAAADTPAGLTFDVKPAVGGLSDPNGLGSSDIKNTTVTLPEGVVINPGQAAGLQACQESEANVHVEDVAPACPLKSKVGTDEAELPILKSALKGNVYVLQSNPPDLRLLITGSGEGVEIKLVLLVHLDERTGRLTATLLETPQAPVSDFRLSFSGGAQAALATPTGCGIYQTTTDFTSWASPFIEDASPTGAFQITSGTDGAPCPGASLPFTPSMIAGSTTDQAGGFTDFSLLLQTPDDQQRIEKLQFKVPQGLLGMISSVPLCPEPQASAGTCSSVSQIGHTVVASGPGPYPLVVPQPGQPPAAIYLTGSYKGAPYGLSIVVPVVVGPFTLQTQIVRAKIEVDPLTAQITVTTDPLPQVIDGVPTDLRTVNAVIDRPGFMFNPTNCSPMHFSGTAFSAQRATSPISSPFQMGSCRALAFKPDLTVSTSGRTSRKNGASLDAKIVYPKTPLGANQASSQSNIKSVKVDLPKQLPSRLTTLQKACTSATFEANPANCPTDSRVGTVSAVTPVLPVTLTGPAYFVSYGGAKFPELVFALQGYGVTIYVHGETFIDKAGITSSTFRSIPDVPIYSFELKLPQGPFSALAANGNLCKAKLKMPTSFTAQDGAVVHQSTPVDVTGCVKTKAKKKTKHKIKKK